MHYGHELVKEGKSPGVCMSKVVYLQLCAECRVLLREAIFKANHRH